MFPARAMSNTASQVEKFSGLEGSLDEDWFRERYEPLLAKSDLELFAQGGCHVMAEALHDEFGYPISIIPGDEPGSVSHAFVLVRRGAKEYAVDVLGFTELDQRLWEFGRPDSQPVSVTQLRLRYRSNKGAGLFAHRIFWVPAYDKARARIREHFQIYSGSMIARTSE
jgi:hypothetical protein